VIVKVLDDASILDILGVVALESLIHSSESVLVKQTSLSYVALKTLIQKLSIVFFFVSESHD